MLLFKKNKNQYISKLLENIRTVHVLHAENSKITLVCESSLYFNYVLYEAVMRG